MTQTMMPDPVAIVVDGDRSRNVKFIANGQDFPPSGTNLITTTQAEAYADAVRREALEEAASVAKQASDKYAYGYYGNEVDTADEIEVAIRSLIPRNDNEQGNY